MPYKTVLHAEVHAIVRCKDLSKAHKITVYRYSVAGEPLLAKPCKICQSAIEAAGIKHIAFTVTA
jgi:tRNA(Arg) A34 adenosine deaminase TadA